MPHYKLIYFDLRAIAEPIRLIFVYAGVPYEDKRIQFEEEWPALKFATGIQKLPILYEDKQELTQSVTIARYLAKKFGLIPEDDYDAARCDEVIDIIGDIISQWRPFVLEKDASEKAKKREELLKIIPISLSKFEEILQANGNNHIAGSKTSWADIALAHYLETFELTIDPEISNAFPELQELKKTVFEIPNIKEWIDKRPKFSVA